ncbi:hypothetical protein [Streptomyces sp. NPDC058614]|uniref:hypothetical protein n=1 Tax=Streptomyces sp. NPDC058614 TaxID=3346557 RepID=UPI003660671E
MERLDQGGGWCGVFWQRDPDGMRACLDGWEVPPWDVVEALLQDVAAEYGDRAAAQETERARALHGASLAAYDGRPGGRDNLGDRLDVLLREQRYAAERQVELGRLLRSAGSQEEADSIRLDLAWAHDDHERATARCAEIRRRMENLDRRDLRTHAEGALNFPAGAAGDAGDVLRMREREGGAQPSGGAATRQGSAERPAEAGYGAPGPGQGRRRSGIPEQTGPRSPFADPGMRDDGAISGASARSGAYAPAERPASNEPAGANPDAYALDYASRARRDGAYAADGLSPSPGVYASQSQRDSAYAADGLNSSPGAHAPHTQRDGAYAPTAQPDNFHAPSARPAQSDTPQPPAEDRTPATPTPKQRSKRRTRGSARFAGMMEPEAETAPVGAPEAAAPSAPAPAARGGRSPRGARFAGVAEEPAQPRTQPMDDEARQNTVETIRTLIRLRSEGRSGEAHAVLVEAAYWPAARFPLLAAELHRAGLDADWATLLWEAASLPADRLVAAADALVAAGRTADGQQMLRQGVARPAPEIGAAVLSLAEEGRRREIGALLGAYVRMRTPEEAARSAEADPQRLVPLLLAAAKGVSEERHWDLVHALRVAGFTA